MGDLLRDSMKGWSIFHGAVDLRERASEIISLGRAALARHPVPGQTGVNLLRFDQGSLDFITGPLERLASDILRSPSRVSLSRSSFRLQPPNGIGALAPHQDLAALDMIGRGRRNLKRLTFWMPLDDLDGSVPTLAIGRKSFWRLPHISDSAGYSILRDKYEGDLLPIRGISVGDVVYLHPRTVHATFVPTTATMTRHSLDIRFFAS